MQRDLPINQVSWLCTHNAFNSQDEIGSGGTSIGGTNQNHDIRAQLNDGVRVFMIDVHNFHSAPRVGHGEGARTHYEDLPDLLAKFKQWLAEEKLQIVIFMMEVAKDVPADWISDHFKKAFGGMLYTHDSDGDTLGGKISDQLSDQVAAMQGNMKPRKEWPSVNELVQQGKRVVVFRETDDQKGQQLPKNMGWYHDMWRYWTETPYSNKSWSNLHQHTYELLRGNVTTASFFNLNHFVDTGNTGSGSAGFAQGMNMADYLKTRALIAWKMRGRRPSLSVDFYKSLPGAGQSETYNTVEVARTLNNIPCIQGKLNIEVSENNVSEWRRFVKRVTWEGLGDLSFSTYLDSNDYRVTAGGDSAPADAVPTSSGGEYCFPYEKQGGFTLTPKCEGYIFTPASVTWDNTKDMSAADFTVTKQ